MKKGGLWFSKTVSRLVGKDCQRDWSHIGIVCYPNIESRDFFRANKIESEEMLTVFIINILTFIIQFILSSVCLDEKRVKGW